MAIEFRCTGCRTRLHVPTRWGGTSVPCPKCRTRVVIPKAGEQRPPTRFESRGVEASLAELDPTPGGVFSDPTFSLPAAPEDPAEPPIPVVPEVTLPLWVVYASFVAVLALVGLSFAAGIFIGGSGRR